MNEKVLLKAATRGKWQKGGEFVETHILSVFVF